MTTHVITRPDFRRAVMWGALFAALWVVVALIRPTSTFHLAPLLTAGAPVVLFDPDDSSRSDRAAVIRLGVVSLGLALLATVAVAAIGAMQGPAFGAFPTPLAEAVVFSIAGSAAGIGLALWLTR